MDLPKNARDLFAEGNELENVKIVKAIVGENGRYLNLYLDGGYPAGSFCVQIGARATDDGFLGELSFDYDEPLGYGADPYGRPDPAKFPEFWRE